MFVDLLREQFFMYDNLSEKLVSIIELSKKKNKILSLGCGTGNLEFRLAKHGFTVVGIDSDSDSINFAIKEAQKLDLNISFLRHDYFSSLTQFDFEVILLMYPTLSLENFKKLLDNIYLSLPQNGIFIFNQYFFSKNQVTEMTSFDELQNSVFCFSTYNKHSKVVSGNEIYFEKNMQNGLFSISIDRTFVPVEYENEFQLREQLKRLISDKWKITEINSLDLICPTSSPPFCNQLLVTIEKL